MNKEEYKGIKPIKIAEIFNEKYIIPIYQRKYAWTNTEIEQLLEDIAYADGNYYLGTLTVDEKEGKYYVIDGQQRLITLCLIMINLEQNINNMLSFEARQIYDNALNTLNNMKENEEIGVYEDNVKEIYAGYRFIENYFKNNDNLKNNFLKKLDNTVLVRVQVPEETDLTNYFEIMNTRGEQLELHHIAKAKFLEALDDDDRNTASIIWDACSQMNTHIQKNFTQKIRKELFKEYLSGSNGNFPTKDSIEEVWNKLQGIFKETADNEGRKKLKDIINGNFDKPIYENKDKNTNDEKPELFESIIKFPYFLLYVNAVINKEEKPKYEFDDKNLLNILKDSNLKDENNKETNAKYFIYAMLYCRILFDKYIIKKQNDDNNQIEDKFILKYVKIDEGEMRNTYGKTDNDYEDDEDSKETHNGKVYKRQQLIVLQSLLRITYTSPRNMDWITTLLKHLFEGKDAGLACVTSELENHCIEKIKKHYNISGIANIKDFNEKRYNDIERIVFTYLDYLLYRDGYKKIIEPKFNNRKVQFRNSIEHFFPQNPENGDNWRDEDLHCFGNLALVSTKTNIHFSNYYPIGKVMKHDKIIQQSPKLKIMASYINDKEEWTPEKAKEHQEEMFERLAEELNREKR